MATLDADASRCIKYNCAYTDRAIELVILSHRASIATTVLENLSKADQNHCAYDKQSDKARLCAPLTYLRCPPPCWRLTAESMDSGINLRYLIVFKAKQVDALC